MVLIENNKIQYLEGIRGVAALIVVFHHFMLAFYPGAYDGNLARAHIGHFELDYYASPLNVLTNGNFCVTVFFVLSGFVLSRKYWEKKNFSIITSAAKRRYFRLFIPVGFTLIVSFILVRFSLYKHVEVSRISFSDWWLGGLWPMDSSFKTFLEFFTYRVMFLGHADYDTSMWTMSKELFGSFLVFGLLAVTHPLKRKFFVFALALFILFAMQKYYYMAFVLGIMLNYTESYSNKTKNPVVSFVVVPVLLIGGLLLGSFPSLGWSHYSFWDFVQKQEILDLYPFIHVIGSMMFVAGVVLSPLMQKIFSNSGFVFLGFISFSLYLIHPLIIGSFTCTLFLDFHETLGYNNTGLIVFLLTILLTIILSWLMTITVDRFSLDFSRKYFGNSSDKNKEIVKKGTSRMTPSGKQTSAE